MDTEGAVRARPKRRDRPSYLPDFLAQGTAVMTATMDETAYDVVNRSFGRCCSSDGFFDTFYTILKNSHPEIPEMFARTDFKKQNDHLRVGLGMMLMFDHGADAARQVVARIRESHARHRLNVRPEFYDCWIASLMGACAEHDPAFSENVEAAWRAVLADGIEYIKSGYDTGTGEADCMSYLNWIDPDLATVAGKWRRLSATDRADVVAIVTRVP